MSRASMLHCSTREPSLSRGVEGDKRGQKRDLKHDGAEGQKESVSLMNTEVTKLTNLRTTTLKFVLYKYINFLIV